MPFLDEKSIRERARQRALREGLSVEESLRRAVRRRETRYDIFLSQTIHDAEIVLGVYDLLTQKMGYRVFCDWIDHPEVDRSAVTPATAAFIRMMMGASDTLLFLDTEHADQSLWMCWELGWFDGEKGHVGVLPVLPAGHHRYRGREFLGLYPYLQVDEKGRLEVVRPLATSRSGLTMIEAPNSTSFDRWRDDLAYSMRPRVLEPWAMSGRG